MNKLLLSLAVLLLSQMGYGQLNMTLLSQLQYDERLNDIWGWHNEATGEEYALVGLFEGVSIVSLADEDNAVEVAYIPGPASGWRDIKTWKNYAYVTNETSDGLLVIDLAQLPDTAAYSYWEPEIPGLGKLTTGHNLFIDEFGLLYLVGSELNNGGVLFIDVDTDPGNPIYLDKGPGIYVHDAYARNKKLYASELNVGRLAIYDVTDLADLTLLGSTPTPFAFTHNAWISDDEQVVFTTDERPNAPVAAYDISDLSNIRELDQFRPVATLSQNVIPHNVHVWNQWLVISYYTDGGIVVDASRPSNLIEVGNFDTFFGTETGFNGTWGAYPFLPSGKVLLSSIGDGLFVLEPNYVQAAWLEGTVRDSLTGQAIQNVRVTIDAAQANLDFSDLLGNYETGLATAGTYAVNFLVEGYYPKTVPVDLENGEVSLLDVELVPLPKHNLEGLTIAFADGSPVPNAYIELTNSLSRFTSSSDAAGEFRLNNVYETTYDVLVAAWGYRYKFLEDVRIDENSDLTIILDAGYQDDFLAEVDNDWTTSATASGGLWEKGEPKGTYRSSGQQSNPETDLPDDLGDQCYITGNEGGSVGNDDVDMGSVTLFSPYMDLSTYTAPILSYHLWFANYAGDWEPNDSLVVSVTNGTDTIVVETVTFAESAHEWRPESEIFLADLLTLTDSMQVIFSTEDLPDSGHVLEAGVDGFSLIDAEQPLPTNEVLIDADLRAFPNPFSGSLQVEFTADTGSATTKQLLIYNAWGQLVNQVQVAPGVERVTCGQTLESGLYFIQLVVDKQASRPIRVVKVE